MLRVLAAAIATFALASSASADRDEILPRPPLLEPQINFWTRIYSEIDQHGGLIHDSEQLDVIYEVLRFPAGIGTRARERSVEKAKGRYRTILRRLARGKRTDLTADEARVLGRWPEGTTNATLRKAARNVRFQLGQADKFRAGLIRAGRWMDFIEKTLIEQGVPPELAVLPHVESSYHAGAYSRVGAAGLWQFTRSTGRRYVRVDHVVDERLDPLLATVGAARLLRDNFRRLKTWPLAITAYNHGVTGMSRAVSRLGTRDIETIVRRYRSRTFGFASRNFYSEFLAALDVDRNAEHYFGPLHPDLPVEHETVVIEHYLPMASVQRALGIDGSLLREHNPALRPSVWSGAKYVPRGYPLRVPKESLDEPVTLALAKIPQSDWRAEQKRDRFHKVRRGDTLSRIARRYRARESDLVALNNLRSRHRIRAGQVLRLPLAAETSRLRVARAAPPPDGIYTVRRGDTVSIIARRFGVSEGDLVVANRLSNRHHINVGQRLQLPGVAPPIPTAIASLESQPTEPAAGEAAGATVVAAVATAPPPDEEGPASPVPEARGGPRPPEAAAAEAEPPAPSAEAVVAALDAPEQPSPDPSNYDVGPNDRIVVQAEETLGHYAEWLEVQASRLRRLNGMRAGTPVVIGRQARLDFSRVSPETFEQRRLEYHRTLQEEFFGSYVVTGTRTHVLRKGDTLWYLARRKYSVPVWLLRQYNPDLDFGSLPAGTPMTIPLIDSRRS